LQTGRALRTHNVARGVRYVDADLELDDSA